ncbi:MAG TPA: hypothetical protein VIY73_04905 [Polyangiaceae bacterium]
MDECEKLGARADALEAAFRRRALRARDEGDIATMVRMRDAAREANEKKAERGALAQNLAADLLSAQAQPAGPELDALMTRLEETAGKSREIAALYEGFVQWEAEPS